MKHHLNIDDETMAVLRASEITANSLKLPPGQLERKLYEKVNKVITTAGGKWNRSAQSHIFTKDPREALGMAIETGAIKDVKKATQAFYTPTALASRLIQHASVDGKTVLEPSAGHGALALAARDAGAKSVFCLDIDADSVGVLKGRNFSTELGDFLQWKPEPNYDRIVMNPPFTAGQDVKHVTHAFKFLKPGGRLVAITSPGWENKSDRHSTAFRELIQSNGYVAERIDAGEFKESGTNVATLMVVLDA